MEERESGDGEGEGSFSSSTPPPARLCLIVGKGGLSVVMYWRRKDEKQGPLHLKRIS